MTLRSLLRLAPLDLESSGFRATLHRWFYARERHLGAVYELARPARMHFVGVPIPDLEPGSPLWSSLDKDDVLMEAGTNLGSMTRELARHVRFVHTFEPNRHALDYARAHVREPNVRFYDMGVSSEDGEEWLGYEGPASAKNSIEEIAVGGKAVEYRRRLKVRTITVDSFGRRTGVRLTGLVLDAEGAETGILQACAETAPKKIFLETHVVLSGGTWTDTLPKCREILESRGYDVFQFRDRGGLTWLGGTKP